LAQKIVVLTTSCIDDPAALSTLGEVSQRLLGLGFDPIRSRAGRGFDPRHPEQKTTPRATIAWL
jgi:hypothetical protein